VITNRGDIDIRRRACWLARPVSGAADELGRAGGVVMHAFE
jgi:hypothetical protein